MSLESHHALIPFAPLPSSASEEEKNVFIIVLECFFTVCMNDCKYNEKSVTFHCGGYQFSAFIRETCGQAGMSPAVTLRRKMILVHKQLPHLTETVAR